MENRDIGKLFGITGERARQIALSARRKLIERLAAAGVNADA